MDILEIKAGKVCYSEPASWWAEALVEDEWGEERYVVISATEDDFFVVSRNSFYNYVFGDAPSPSPDGFVESYYSWKEAAASEYIHVFEKLYLVLRMMR